jgi:hypothetical protein
LLCAAAGITPLPAPTYFYTFDLAAKSVEERGRGICSKELRLIGFGVWTDGVKSDPDMDVEARKICAANGSECM